MSIAFSFSQESFLADFAAMRSFTSVLHHVSFPVDEVHERFLADRTGVRSNVEVNSLVDLKIFLPREAFRASVKVANEWLFVCVQPKMIDELIFLVKPAAAERARIFSAYMNVVHVIEDVRLEPKRHAAGITGVWFYWHRLSINDMFLFVVPKTRQRRQNFAAD